MVNSSFCIQSDKWMIQVPTLDKPKTVPFNSQIFHKYNQYVTIQNNRLLLSTPSNGGTFNGSPNRPRTELKQKKKWSPLDLNELQFSFKILNARMISFLQIFNGDDDWKKSPTVLICFWKKTEGIYCKYRENKDSNAQRKFIAKVDQNTRVNVHVKVENGKVTFMFENRKIFSFNTTRSKCFFKAGNYVQSNDQGLTRMSIYSIKL